MPTYTALKGVTDIRKVLLTQTIVNNLTAFLEWGILSAEGFVNVDVPTPGVNSPYALETLAPVHIEGTVDGAIWESEKANWVYETGLPTNDQPIVADGVYVNGTHYPTSTTSGAYEHYINFPQGRVIFTSPIPTSSIVQASYSYRWINIYDSDEPWFRDVVLDAYLLQQGFEESGQTSDATISLLGKHRSQLPAIIIEPVMSRRQDAYQIGSGTQWQRQDILFHLIAERSDEKTAMMDILMSQKDKTFWMYDPNARALVGDFPLDWRGSPVAGGKNYPGLVEPAPAGYRWKRATFERVVGQEVSPALPLYRGIVRATLGVVSV